MTIIEQLKDADKTLDADGYKEYCYVRIAISEAIKALHNLDETKSQCDRCGNKSADINSICENCIEELVK